MARSSSPSDASAAAILARPPLAVVPVALVSAALTGMLVAVSGRYGYHRDELYFLAAGHHLAWGYPDQPPLAPAIARAVSVLAPGSLPLLRLPSAVAMGGVVWTTALIARELGAARPAQVLAAGCVAVSAVVLGAGHLLSTMTFQLITWALLCWLVIRLLRGADERLWLAAGVVTAIGLLDNVLIASLALALFVGVLVAGPRDVLRSWWLVAGALVALAAWAPYLAWQAAHGWPQVDMSRAIAAGSSGSSQPRSLFLPFQLLLVSPWLAPIWLVGLWRLLRDDVLRTWRSFGVAYVVLVALVLVTAGKPYYVTGLYPVLLAAGSLSVVRWWRRGRAGLRHVAVAAAFALTVPSFVLTLPLLPVDKLRDSSVVDLNYDAGETVGWPAYVAEIAGAYRRARAEGVGATAVITSNYGEAGAVDRYGAALGVTRAYSGHNGYWYWGPPDSQVGTVVAVGFGQEQLRPSFASCDLATRLDNHVGVDDDEQQAPVWICSRPRASWRRLWPGFRVLG